MFLRSSTRRQPGAFAMSARARSTLIFSFVRSTTDTARGKYARTEWKVLATDAATTLAEATLKTGRRNQIRVQFADAGHPVVGDAKYGHGTRGQPLCLHAWKLAFIHPHTRQRAAFEMPPPPFARVPGVTSPGDAT